MIALLEEGALDTLLAQLGGDTALRQRFLRDFVRLWDSRADRLDRSLAAQDLEEAHVVLLSIRSTSEMVGAVVLEATAALVHSALTAGDLDGCRRHLPRLSEVGASTCAELAALADAADAAERAGAAWSASPARRWQHPPGGQSPNGQSSGGRSAGGQSLSDAASR